MMLKQRFEDYVVNPMKDLRNLEPTVSSTKKVALPTLDDILLFSSTVAAAN